MGMGSTKFFLTGPLPLREGKREETRKRVEIFLGFPK